MAVQMHYRVPYQVTFAGIDLASGKPVVNLLYGRTKVQTVAPPAYGGNPAGSSSLDVWTGAILIWWQTYVLPIICASYQLNSVTTREIIGWGTATTPLVVTGATNATPIAITTQTEHDYSTGQQVSVVGATGNTAANGTWTITVTGPNTLTLNGSGGNGVYTGGATIQALSRRPNWLYGLQYSITVTNPTLRNGSRPTPALPLYVTQSTRRIAALGGRNFRSLLRLGPIAEADTVDGALTPARYLAVQTLLAGAATSLGTNGGSDATSGLMEPIAVSKKLGLLQPTPFTTADPFTSTVSLFTARQNLGSAVRRKPKLTSNINQI